MKLGKGIDKTRNAVTFPLQFSSISIELTAGDTRKERKPCTKNADEGVAEECLAVAPDPHHLLLVTFFRQVSAASRGV